jgi:hypothetical protein
MNEQAFDSRCTRSINLDVGPTSQERSWAHTKFFCKGSEKEINSTGNPSHEGEGKNSSDDSDTSASSRFIARTELVYVRPTKLSSKYLDNATNSFRLSPGIENKNHMDDKSIVFPIESDVTPFQASARSERNIPPNNDFSNR